jgi:hypothetical protein
VALLASSQQLPHAHAHPHGLCLLCAIKHARHVLGPANEGIIIKATNEEGIMIQAPYEERIFSANQYNPQTICQTHITSNCYKVRAVFAQDIIPPPCAYYPSAQLHTMLWPLCYTASSTHYLYNVFPLGRPRGGVLTRQIRYCYAVPPHRPLTC